MFDQLQKPTSSLKLLFSILLCSILILLLFDIGFAPTRFNYAWKIPKSEVGLPLPLPYVDSVAYFFVLDFILMILIRTFGAELANAQPTTDKNVKCFIDHPGRAYISVKRMGELAKKPFLSGCKRQCCSLKGGANNALKLAYYWKERPRNPNWDPFKIVTIKEGDKEILDEEDELIAEPKSECDEDVYNAVVTSLKELKEYNPIDRYPLSELWNNKYKRKATLKEGVEYLLKQWKTHKQRHMGAHRS